MYHPRTLSNSWWCSARSSFYRRIVTPPPLLPSGDAFVVGGMSCLQLNMVWGRRGAREKWTRHDDDGRRGVLARCGQTKPPPPTTTMNETMRLYDDNVQPPSPTHFSQLSPRTSCEAPSNGSLIWLLRLRPELLRERLGIWHTQQDEFLGILFSRVEYRAGEAGSEFKGHTTGL